MQIQSGRTVPLIVVNRVVVHGMCIEGKDERGPARLIWDWVGGSCLAGHNIVKVRSISKMHIPKLLLQLNIILGIGFADHSQVFQELYIFFRTSCECSRVDPRAVEMNIFAALSLSKKAKTCNNVLILSQQYFCNLLIPRRTVLYEYFNT